jgi:hypothetical protein
MVGAVGALAMLLLTFSAPAESRTAAATACSTQGLLTRASAGGYKVVRITTEGLSCTKARAVAREVAQQVIHNKAVSVAGVMGFGMSTQTCPGCTPTTEISLTYSTGGKLTVSLRGPGSGKSAPSPSPTPIPGLGSGSGTIIV